MINLKIDPEFQSQIPPLTDDEFKQLEENILKEGKLLSPLIVWNNTLVDGHNRYAILDNCVWRKLSNFILEHTFELDFQPTVVQIVGFQFSIRFGDMDKDSVFRMGNSIPLNHFQKDVFLFFLRFLVLLIDHCIFRCFCRFFLCHNHFPSVIVFLLVV